MKVVFYNRGFTLIDLLVVISIIGLLSSVVLATLDSARVKARDAQRITALKQIQTALELYYADNGRYPGWGGSGGVNGYTRSPAAVTEAGSPLSKCGYGAPGTPGAGSSSYAPGIWCKLETALAPYLKELPNTTSASGPYYAFYYKVPSTSQTYNPNNIQDYGLAVRLERANDLSRGDGGWSDNLYEVGHLPKYCSAKNSNWNSWSPVPCSCTTYYTVGCVY